VATLVWIFANLAILILMTRLRFTLTFQLKLKHSIFTSTLVFSHEALSSIDESIFFRIKLIFSKNVNLIGNQIFVEFSLDNKRANRVVSNGYLENVLAFIRYEIEQI